MDTDIKLDEVPEHSNDIGDWCPYSGTMQPGGECPQWCRQASDPEQTLTTKEA